MSGPASGSPPRAGQAATSGDVYLSSLPQDERLARVWAKDGALPRARSAEELRLELRADMESSEEDVFFSLCAWTWRGYVEQVLELLESDQGPFLGEPFRVLRASLLMKLGRQKEATEIVELLQQSKIIAAKVLCAVVTFEWNERSTAVDMLYKLLGQLKQIGASGQAGSGEETTAAAAAAAAPVLLDIFLRPLLPVAARAWQQRIMALLVACYSTSGNYVLALDLCQAALDDIEDQAPEVRVGGENAHVPTLLQIGRLRLQIGDVEGAREVLSDLEGDMAALGWNDSCAVQVLRGLCEFAEGDFESAETYFAKLLDQVNSPDAPGEDAANPYVPEDMLAAIFTVQEPLAATLANNLSLCHLNLCDLGGAIRILEDCIRNNPMRNMHRTLVFNLCTLYDLARPKEQSRQAKVDLQQLARLLHIEQRFDAQKDLRL